MHCMPGARIAGLGLTIAVVYEAGTGAASKW
jgi:hypothetical protein